MSGLDFAVGGIVRSPGARLGEGVESEFQLDRMGGLATSSSRGQYWDQADRGNMYTAAAQAAVTFAAGLSTTAVFTLYNPAQSGMLLVLQHIGFAFSAAPAAAATVYLTGNLNPLQAAPTGTTPIVVRNCKLGSGTGVGLVYSAATLAAAPIVLEPLVSILAVGSITPPAVDKLINGRLEIPEGIYVTIQASAACAGFPSITWLEVPSPNS